MSDKNDEQNMICNLLDKLTLDILLLIEEEIETKLNIENLMALGETNLAKARYIMGQNKVSKIQLPTYKTPEFRAAVNVYGDEDLKLLKKEYYEIHKTDKANNENILNPMKWFGVLVPQNLTHAQKMFKQTLQWIVKAVNIQIELYKAIETINILKVIKRKLLNK